MQLTLQLLYKLFKQDENLKKNTHPMNKEVPSSRMGMEEPEAAAEEYTEKVTQSENSARGVVIAREPAPGGFSPGVPGVGSGRGVERVWLPAGGGGDPRSGKSRPGQLVELRAGKRNPWKFPI